MIDAAIFLCDKTGIAARPWAMAGIECFCIDVEHSIRKDKNIRGINYTWGDVRSWAPPSGLNILFIAAFPPCTHVAGSGARDFSKKRGYMLRDALETFEACRQAIGWSGAKGYIENSVGVLSGLPHIGKPDHMFHPFQYAGYTANPDQDAYTKKTCIWGFNGFEMPAPKPVDPILGSKMWKLPPSADRAHLRSATPLGWSVASFMANAPSKYIERFAA